VNRHHADKPTAQRFFKAPMKPSSVQEPKQKSRRKPPPPWLLNTMTALVGILTLALGVGWLIRSWIVDMEIPYFAIPLVMCVPVIVAVAFRNFWD
jgi:Na+/glutamate symporter